MFGKKWLSPSTANPTKSHHHPSFSFSSERFGSLCGRAVQKTLFSKSQNFQINLLLTHKSKTIGTIFVALWSNIFCEIGICCFSLLLKIRQKSEGSQNSTLEWSEVDLKVWNGSFGGVFLLESGFEFFMRATETPFSVHPKLPKYMHLS